MMFIDELYFVHVYRERLYQFINKRMEGRISKRYIKPHFITAGYEKGYCYMVHHIFREGDRLVSKFKDFEILEIYNQTPTEEDQKAYQEFMASIYKKDYIKALEEYKKSQNGQDDQENDVE